MSEQIQLLEGESIIAELIAPDDYIKQRNQIPCITSQHLIFLKQKTIGVCNIIEYIPLSDSRQVIYKKSLAIGATIGEVFLTIIGLLVFIFAVTSLLISFQIVILGVPFIGVGGTLVAGMKRYKLFF